MVQQERSRIADNGRPPPATPAILAAPALVRRRRYLDGIRGASAVYVVISHCWDTWKPTATVSARWLTLSSVMGLGRWAVAVFIVVSGFSLCITPWRNAMQWPGGASSLLRGRFRRIVPPYWVAVAVSCLLAVSVLSRDAGTLYDLANNIRVGGVVTHLVLVQDVIWLGPAGSSAFWSIAVEFHIYLLFGVSLVLMRRWVHAWAAIIVALLALSIYACVGHSGLATALRGLSVTMYPAFFLGFGAAQFTGSTTRRSRTVAVLLMCLVGVTAAATLAILPTHRRPLDPLVDLVIAAISTGMLAALAASRLRRTDRVLSSRLLCYLGSFSFSLYLVHAVVIELIWRGLIVVLPQNSAWFRLVCETVVGVSVSVAVARVFYLTIERRYMNNVPERAVIDHRAFAASRRRPVSRARCT